MCPCEALPSACTCVSLPAPQQRICRRVMRRWRKFRMHAMEKKLVRLTYTTHYNTTLLHRTVSHLYRVSVGRGARNRIARRALFAWRRIAHRLHTLKHLEKVQMVAVQRRCMNTTWSTWRREKHVQGILEAYGVHRLQDTNGFQLGRLVLARWRGDGAANAVITCWRAWRRSVRRCVRMDACMCVCVCVWGGGHDVWCSGCDWSELCEL